MNKDISIRGLDGSFMGYLALPAGDKGPGVVVIQETFGVNSWVRSVADWYAAQGFFALAPDLFWRLQPGIQLDPTKGDEFKLGIDYYGRFSVDKGVEDIQASIATLRGLPGCTGKVGNLGFCLGGLLSFLSAARTDTDASSSYYGGGINAKLAEAKKIKKPLLVHLAGNDAFMPKAAEDQIAAELDGMPNVAVHVYPGVAHGFCRSTDPRHYDANACQLAHDRTLAMFKKALT